MTRKKSSRPEKDQGKPSGIDKQGKKQQMTARPHELKDGGAIHEDVEGSRAEGAAGTAGGQQRD